ncbi:type II toxin-antitoxin system RelB family antitoxin [Culicoidibacter larvae]|uniref:CopG family transcriptional regulator n=1 Tax=Culicoidibacter larvae TaxID=2579976 RepID=A0A5R8QJA7_9FIRM|nr:DUF6290 family protein [Culicoidibacter larvae]TLG77337.1 hypothetical protein FEZ08_01585 [Culicoidibacter larvae]
MAHLSLRVSEQEKKFISEYAKMHGLDMSEVLKEAFFEKVEDELDLKAIAAYEQNKDGEEHSSFDDVAVALGLEDVL